jgi:hypothetical protein
MPVRPSAIVPLSLVLAAVPLLATTAITLQPLERTLGEAATYVAEYERTFSTVVSEELYVQRLRASQGGQIRETRRLRSDTLLANAGDAGWFWFRDVFEVDGRAVRERDSRLHDLFLKPSADSREQAGRITEESARFNLGALQRTINVPTLALLFLRTDEQRRSRFTLERMAKVDGREAVQVRFVEVAEPRLIKTPDEAPAGGRVWIAPGGEILRTELEIVTEGSRGLIRVTYARDEKLGMLVPVTMTEDYAILFRTDQPLDRPSTITSTLGSRPRPGQHLEGRATYSRFRQFSVTTSTIIRDDEGPE